MSEQPTAVEAEGQAVAGAEALRRTEFLFVLGCAFAAVGLGALICAFGPFFYTFSDEPLWLASASLLLPVGLALMLAPDVLTRAAAPPPSPDPAAAPTPHAS